MSALTGGVLWALTDRETNSPFVANLLKQNPKSMKTKVALVKTSHRASGIQQVINLLEINPVKGKNVFLICYYNLTPKFIKKAVFKTHFNFIQLTDLKYIKH